MANPNNNPPLLSPSRRETYFRLLRYIVPYKRVFILALIATVLYAIAEASIAGLMQPLLDGTFIEKDPFYTKWIPLIIAGVFLFRGIMAFASEMGMQSVATSTIRDIRKTLFSNTLNLPDVTLSQVSSGKLQSLFTFNAQEMLNATTNVLTILVRDTVVIIGLVGFIFYQHWQLAVILFIIVPLIALITRAVNQKLKQQSGKLLKSIGEIGQRVNETINGHRQIKIYNATKTVSKLFNVSNDHVRSSTLGVTRTRIIASQSTMLLTVIAMAMMIYVAIYYANRDELTVGQFISIFTAMAMLLSPIKRLTQVNELLQRGISASEQVFEWLDQDKENINTSASGTPTKSVDLAGDIHIHEVSLRYPGATSLALDNASLSIPFGSTLALVGLSGGGKTSLMHMLPRLLDPTSGHISINGHIIQDVNLVQLRTQMSYVGQFPVLFDLSIIGNLSLSDDKPNNDSLVEKRAIQALKDAHAWDFVDKLPKGIHTLVGPNGANLSGGQRQRIALARALYHDTPFLLLDEVTSALDAESEKKIQKALNALKGKKTTILVAHRLSTVRNADQIAMLSEGKILEVGTHESLMNQSGAYAQLVSQQMIDP